MKNLFYYLILVYLVAAGCFVIKSKIVDTKTNENTEVVTYQCDDNPFSTFNVSLIGGCLFIFAIAAGQAGRYPY